MRRLLIAIATAIISISASAQEHMKFKGHSMGCTVSEMVELLKKDGYQLTEQDENLASMKGVFSGTEAIIYLYPNQSGNLNKAVVVYDMTHFQWKPIKAHMENLETGLKKKYGEPVISTKEFDELYKDGREIMGFKMGKNEYNVVWELETGNIMLMFSASHSIPPIVLLSYIDKINSVEADQQAYDDL